MPWWVCGCVEGCVSWPGGRGQSAEIIPAQRPRTHEKSALLIALFIYCVHWYTDWDLQGFCKEVVAWSALRHPNVLPLLGATMTGTRFAMVSEWMTDGNINEFVESHPDADRLGLVGVPFESPPSRPSVMTA